MERAEATKRKLPAGKACKACRTRKHRCDGKRPQCSNCATRSVTCEYPLMPAEEMSIQELRSVMETKLREQAEMRASQKKRVVQNSEAGLGDQLRSSSRALNSFVPEETMHSSSRPLGPTTPALDRQPSPRNASPEALEPEIGGSEYFGESSTFAFVSEVREREPASPPRGYKRRRMTGDRGLGEPRLDDISLGFSPSQEINGSCGELLPSKELADSLLTAYFTRVHLLYPYIHERTFRLEYERMSLDRNLPRTVWVGLLNMIFAHGVEFCDLVPEEKSVAVASSFVNNARRIIFSHVFKEASLELVQALLLLCQYLQSTLELNECWNLVGVLIRTAVGLGLHLNPATDLPVLEREFRIRTWWGCFIIDRTLSMKFGRPPAIDGVTAFDVDLPLEVDDEYLDLGLPAPRQPDNQPSLITFFNRTVGIVDIMGKVLQELYHPRKIKTNRGRQGIPSAARNDTHSYIISNSAVLDSELVTLWDQIPAHLKQEPPIPDGPEFELQRNVILTRYISLRLLIHRQSFLVFSKHEINDPFQRAVAVASCRVCISTAGQAIEVVHEHHHRRMLNSLWYSLHYVFTAMGVLLSLRTMDKSKLDAIGETGQEDRTLELGMDFLKTASRISTLAARYVAMLKRIWPGSTTDSASIIDAGAAAIEQHPIESDRSVPSLAPLIDHGAELWHSNPLEGVPMFSDLDLVDFNSDLLFGTGLPRDLLSTDWSTFGLSL